MPLTEEQGVGAKQTVIMQGLHHRYTLGSGRIVSGGRDERKSVVDVHDVGPPRTYQAAQLAVGRHVEHRSPGHGGSTHFRQAIVMSGVADHLMPVSFQQGRLSGENLILTAGLLIMVVE
jgi:hypothetical protein